MRKKGVALKNGVHVALVGSHPGDVGTPQANLTTGCRLKPADQAQYGGDISYGGQTDRLNTAMPGQYLSNNAYFLIFDANEDLVIKSVKVYANGAADRTIAVVDGNGNTVVSGVFSIPDGESRVNLNFDVPAGTGYGLRVTSDNPQLWRDGNGSNPPFPFALGTLGSITTTNVTSEPVPQVVGMQITGGP